MSQQRGKDPIRTSSKTSVQQQSPSDDPLYTSVIDGLKHLYRQKMKPLEETYKYGLFFIYYFKMC